MSPSPSTTSLVAGALAAFAAGGLATAAYLKKSSSSSTSFPATQQDRPLPSISYPEYNYSKDPKGSFMKICDMLIQELIQELPQHYELPQRETEWLHKMLNYTVKGGKMNRGLTVVDAGVAILGNNPTNDQLVQLAILGWAIEWLQAWLLVADDIMDSSVTRRGQACWYKTLGEAWYIAINDAVTIESLVYKMLKKHFAQDTHTYVQLLDLLMETTLQTELGQLSDTLCDILDLPDLTPDRWQLIVKYKTSFYSFYLSVAFAMVLGGVKDPAAYNAAREILIIMGVYFQAQDDYLDCYGTEQQIGKIGTDIQDKKCGWLFTKAYHELANAEQKKFLDQHYGKCKVGSLEEKKIKSLYTELGLPRLYEEYEQASYDKIMALKDSEAGATLEAAGVPWKVFETFLRKVYKRSK